MGSPEPVTESTPPAPPARFGPWRREMRAFLELMALTGIAVAQPTLDLLSKNANLFVTRRSSTAEMLALTAIIVVAPALLMWVVEVAVGLAAPQLRRFAHAALAALAAGITAIEIANRQASLTSRVLLLLALVAGAIAGYLVLRFAVVRLWLRYLSIAPFIFAGLFIFSSPATSVIFQQGPQSGADVKVGRPARVVMIVMDELPVESLLDGTGSIDAALFPNFAAFAADATWYRNETTVAPNTNEAVPAILSGSYPEPDAIGTSYAYPHNLFTLLGDTYEMNVEEPVTHLCPSSMCDESRASAEAGTAGFSGLLRDTWDLWRNFASLAGRQASLAFNFRQQTHFAPDAYERGLRFVRSITPATEPRLDFLHVLLPHRPWHYNARAQSYEAGNMPGTVNTAWVNESVAESGRQRHLLTVQTADRLLGEVVARLRRIGAYDESLIVFTTDHGVAFTPGNPIRGASSGNYPEIMWTPLLIKAPGQADGAVVDRPVRSIDVLPTIADLLETKLPWRLDGHSVAGANAARPQDPPRLLKWYYNRLQPPPGSDYITVDGPAGFAAAMQGRASSSTAAPNLRLYQLGPYGGLVGQEAAPRLQGAAPDVTAAIDDAQSFENVNPNARNAPWTYIRGRVSASVGAQPLAISVNGAIGAVVQPYAPPGKAPESRAFFGALPPQLFRSGRNQIEVYAVRGSPADPQLAPVTLAGTTSRPGSGA